MEKSAKNIWDRLKSYGFTDAGCAGVLGNAQAESALRSNNAQDSGNNRLGMTDEEYTAAVDIGAYKNFVHDSIGYGLFQWTYWSRKQMLLDYARSKGASIGDEDMQIDFFVDEIIKSYHSVYRTLATTHSVREASDAMLLDYERPANQSESNQNRRAELSQAWYDKFHEEAVEEAEEKILHEEQIGDYIYRVILAKERIPKEETVTYTVESGDTLSAIARRFNTTVEALCEANGIEDPNRIRAGQVLTIPTT